MIEFYKCFCPVCKKVTEMDFHDSGHERNSSNDYYTCSKCGENFYPSFGNDVEIVY